MHSSSNEFLISCDVRKEREAVRARDKVGEWQNDSIRMLHPDASKRANNISLMRLTGLQVL